MIRVESSRITVSCSSSGDDDIDDKNIEEASQKNIRHMLNDEAFKIMARWTKKAKDEGKIHDACVLHAH